MLLCWFHRNVYFRVNYTLSLYILNQTFWKVFEQMLHIQYYPILFFHVLFSLNKNDKEATNETFFDLLSNKYSYMLNSELRFSWGNWWTVAGQRKWHNNWTPCSCATSQNTKRTTKTSELYTHSYKNIFRGLWVKNLTLSVTDSENCVMV